MGPKGRNVVLDKKYGNPLITNDGVTIAKDVELEDAFENMGASLVREVATKTNDVAGDGTTTATVLAQAIVNEGIKNVTAGANPMVMRKGINKAVAAAVEAIKGNSQMVSGSSDIARLYPFQGVCGGRAVRHRGYYQSGLPEPIPPLRRRRFSLWRGLRGRYLSGLCQDVYDEPGD